MKSHVLKKDYVFEIINESVFIVLVSFIFCKEHNTGWSKEEEYLFICLIISGFVVQAIISFGKDFKKLSRLTQFI